METVPTSDTRTFVVLNPKAGRGDPNRVHEVLQRHLSERQVYEIYETTGEEKLVDVVGDALSRGFNQVYAAGGDGTVSGVVDALVGRGVPLGILPVGTSNALVREFGIPLDIDKACALLAGPHDIRVIDALKVRRRYYVLRVGIGFDSLILGRTEREEKKQLGTAAYWLTGIKALRRLRPAHYLITIDGEEHHFRAVQVMLINAAASSLPLLDWGVEIEPDDGRIAVCVLRGRTLSDYVRPFLRRLVDASAAQEEICCLTAHRTITVAAATRQLVHGDGELIGHTPIEAEVIPQAVPIIVPLRSGKQRNGH